MCRIYLKIFLIKMECNTGLQLALNLLKSAGVSFYNEKIYHKISIGIAVVLVGFMMILGIIEPIKNFQSYEKIPEHVEIVSNYSLVRMWTQNLI